MDGIWKWDYVESDGKITVPFIIDESSFSQQPGFPDQIRANLAEMSLDLGCVKLKEVAHDVNNGYSQGLMFVGGDKSGGCWSFIGRNPNGTNGLIGQMSDWGAPNTFQVFKSIFEIGIKKIVLFCRDLRPRVTSYDLYQDLQSRALIRIMN